MRFGELTFEDIREKARAGWLAVVPTGCTEQQGPHLPVDFDTWFVQEVTTAAADLAATKFGVHALVLPAMPFGPTPEHRNFGAGFVDVPAELHDRLVASVLDSLAAQAFRRIVVWRGCGQHRLDRVVAEFNAAHAGGVRASLPELPYHDIWVRVGLRDVPSGHADSFATSIALYLRPGAVRADRIHDPKSSPVDSSDPNLDFFRYSPTGVIGDPTHASADLGRRLWTEIVEAAARAFKAAAE